MYRISEGTVFNQEADLIVNTVNCDGFMGKGLALEFKLRYPEMFAEYKSMCANNEIKVGNVYLHESNGTKILSFPTKNHWRYPSKIEYIEEGLKNFLDNYQSFGIQSVAFPMLGTANGGLKLEVVEELMKKYLVGIKDIEIIYCRDTTVAQGIEKLMLEILKDRLKDEQSMLSFKKDLGGRIDISKLKIIKYNFPDRFFKISALRNITQSNYERIFTSVYELANLGDRTEHIGSVSDASVQLSLF